MHNPFDRFAKDVGKAALTPSGPTIAQREIARDAQYADIWHSPDPERSAERERLGLLGDLAAHACLIEAFGHAPSAAEIRRCLSKHFAHWEEHERSTRARPAARRGPRRLEAHGAPFLWLVVASASAPLLRKLSAEPAPALPRGVYVFGYDLFRAGIVVASELPRARSTLLVRLIAAGPALMGAILELAALPEDAFERVAAERHVVRLQRSLERKQDRTPEEEELVVTMQGTWRHAREVGRDEGRALGRDEGRALGRDEGRALGRDEGRDEGRAEARAGDVLTVLRVRGIAVPDAARGRILEQSDPERLERWLERAVLATSVADVLDEPS